MTIILIGLNHQTTPIEYRENLALSGQRLQSALHELKHTQHSGTIPELPLLHEGVILSTCNRLEIYAVAQNHDVGWETVESFLTDYHNIAREDIRPNLYRLEGNDVVEHLMKVASGIDSMILGEPQILGQVSQAFVAAQQANMTGPILSHLFAQAIHAGKRVRTDTDISRFTTSVSHAGTQLLLNEVKNPAPNILIIGAGEIAQLAAKSLHKQADTNLAFINRSHQRAQAFADAYNCLAFKWDQIGDALIWADAVFTATGAPHIVINKSIVEESLTQRAERPLLFVDIAVPRDVDSAVDTLGSVQRFDIDDLKSIVDANTNQRQAAIPAVENIISNEVARFFEWYHSLEVTPIITNLRRRANEVAQLEIEQALNKLGDVDEHTTEIINQLAHRIVNKILHEPTVRLRGQAAEGNGYGYAHAVSELFGLHNGDHDLADIEHFNHTDKTADLSCMISTQQ